MKNKIDINYICRNKCQGIDKFYGACCTLDNRNYIIGVHKEKEIKEFLKKLSKKFDRQIKKEEIFIEYEEGKNLFYDKQVWQDANNYPALRVDTENNIFPCIFYNLTLKQCSIYEIRPYICREFLCSFLKSKIKKYNHNIY